MLKDMFKKTYAKIGPKYRPEENAFRAETDGTVPEIPAGLWRKCNKCSKPIVAGDVRNNFYICPRCGGYFRVHARRRIEMLADEGSFTEWDEKMEPSDPLGFPGYGKKLAAAREKTGLDEAVVTGKLTVGGFPAVIGVCDARFLMGSMGHVVGEKITRAVERATEERLPVILFACSGGARMQEGMISLMQMAKTAAALRRHHEAGQLFVSVLTDPTTGGVTASFAMLGDIILAEPKALIGFAGPRVIEQTIGQKLPEGFQSAEFLLEHGFVDAIVKREEQKETLTRILKIHAGKNMTAPGRKEPARGEMDQTPEVKRQTVEGGEGPDSQQDAENAQGAGPQIGTTDGPNLGSQQTAPEQNRRPVPATGPTIRSAWDSVLLSRRGDRLVASDYIGALFEDFIELHGDRCFGDDGAVIGGIARFHGIPVTVIGQEKGRTTKDNLHRNFGMPSPEGYRKAQRLMRQAETFGRPVICFVDTPGAFCGIEAEERGQGEAIAESLFLMSSLTVPVLSIVIGEGGSGGALALATANEVWMMENATYSVLSPEGFASILWKDSKKAGDAAKIMKITAAELKELGIVEHVITEPEPASRENLSELADELELAMKEFFAKWLSVDGKALADSRYKRFRRF